MEKLLNLQDEREKIESMRKEVREMVEELKDEGYKFKFREEGSEFIIGFDDREVRFPVMGVIPVQEKKGDSPTPYTIQEVIRASIAEPGSNLVETLHKFQKQDAEEKIRLEALHKELRDFQKKEETGEEKSSHLIETPGYPKVNLDVLTKRHRRNKQLGFFRFSYYFFLIVSRLISKLLDLRERRQIYGGCHPFRVYFGGIYKIPQK